MERDFMGLTSKDSVIVVKEEAVEGCKDPVFSKSSAVQWPLSDGFEAFNNRQGSEVQQRGTQFPITMNNPFFRATFSGAPVKQQLLGAGATEPWYSPKASCAPAQLTIFYGGTVNVYDDISPEKAQAIMFLAGNGASVAAATTPQARAQAQAQAQARRTPAGDGVYVSSALSSPISVSSPHVGQMTAVPLIKDEAAKAAGGSGSSLGEVMQSAVPQARKASLARFLEKRKERVLASAPYSLTKSPSDCPKPGSSNTNVLATEQC